MKNILIYLNDFDPLTKSNLSLINLIKDKINIDTIYLGLNKKSKEDNLSPFLIRKAMLKHYIDNSNNIYKFTNISIDYNNLNDSLKSLITKFKKDNNYYLAIDSKDYLKLQNNLNLNKLKKYCKLIIGDDSSLKIKIEDPNGTLIFKMPSNDPNLIINDKDYSNLDEITKEYIINHNIYLKKQIKPYLTLKRYLHSLSVAKTALLINKEGNLGLDPYKVERAGLLHDVAKYLDKDLSKSIMHNYYREYENEDYKILHQYLGEYIAKVDFKETDKDILNAIKYHTTGRKNMSLMEKLIYVADKIEPTREFETQSKIDLCIKDFNKGFLLVLSKNKVYIESKKNITNKDTLECFNYYLK